MRNAESNVTQAWGLYRSPQAFRQQLDEEKAERKAQARFAREAASLQGRSDWRTAQLGRRNESVRRVLLAQEEAQRERARLQKMQNDLAAAKLQQHPRINLMTTAKSTDCRSPCQEGGRA